MLICTPHHTIVVTQPHHPDHPDLQPGTHLLVHSYIREELDRLADQLQHHLIGPDPLKAKQRELMLPVYSSSPAPDRLNWSMPVHREVLRRWLSHQFSVEHDHPDNPSSKTLFSTHPATAYQHTIKTTTSPAAERQARGLVIEAACNEMVAQQRALATYRPADSA